MADMRMIDANALLRSFDVAWMTEYDETGCGMERKALPVKSIEEAPTIDAVPVVRCRECIYSSKSKVSERHRGCAYWAQIVKADGFCSEGVTEEKYNGNG